MLARRIALAAILLSSPATASASPFWEQWTAHIPCASFVQTCPDVTLWSRSTVGVGSRIALTFRNPYNLGGSLLPWWVLEAFPQMFMWPDLYAQGWYAEGRVDSLYGSTGASGFLAPINSGGFLSLTFGDGGALLGCNPPGNYASLYGYYSLCPQTGFGGSVTFYYDVNDWVTLPEITNILVWGAGIQFQNGIPASARDESNFIPGAICNDVLACTLTVAPEPSTWVLLGSGLSLLPLVRIRRRRPGSQPASSSRGDCSPED